jgi:O-antigen/teichoic acid export membrane protein
VYGIEFRPAYPALLILLPGYGCANVFNWNRPLLLALGLPGYPLKISTWVGLAKTVMTLFFLPIWGYLAEAAILSGYLLITVLANVWRGLRQLKFTEKQLEWAAQ